MVVIDTTGIHEVTIDYCGCGILGSSRPVIQILRNAWWPATMDKPRTAITFNVLHHFHAISLQGKVSMYDYYLSLSRLVDNTGVKKVHVSEQPLFDWR